MLSRRDFLRTAAAAGILATVPVSGFGATTGEPAFAPELPLIPAPDDPRDWPEFRARLFAWRAQKQRELKYTGDSYRQPAFAWAARCFACCFLMLCDETFYDARRGRFQPEPFFAHARREFGGFDAVVLWHAYPRIGFDDRNQFDFYRDQPGGLTGLRQLTRAFQAQGVRVFIDYNPWDTGTRREGKSDADGLVDLLRAMGADGVFLDTMDQGAAGFRAKLDAVRPGLVLESEIALPLERIADHHLSWAQWFGDSETPGVLRNKWFERRHLQHQIKRWDRDHSGELHTAWMNGSGMMIWENVFGTWVGWNARDRSRLRAMLPIQRRFADLFTAGNWTPLVPTEPAGVYASEWSDGAVRLWTLVNRTEKPVKGPLLKTTATGENFYDLIAGRAIKPTTNDGVVTLEGELAPRGIGCFVALAKNTARPGGWSNFLAKQRALHRRADEDATFPDRHTKLVRAPATPKRTTPPAGMIEIPATRFSMTVEFRCRECGFYESTAQPDLVGPELSKHREFKREVSLSRYAMDETPVTNAEYARFLHATRYRPRHPENFLRHWVQGVPPVGREDHPVVYVALEDARAYARWAGKRLPTEEEWQFAAEGPEHRRYPWGDELRAGDCNDGKQGGSTAVKQFPAGRSAFGIYDLCGNVWHWTESERHDGRTRFCILKGGSWYRAEGTPWYADGGPRPCGFAAKFLLTWPGLDRCATIGFRCVVDLSPANGAHVS